MMAMKESVARTAEAVMAIAHVDSCFVFDVFDDGMLVAARAPESKRPQVESIRARMDLTTWDELRAHLLSYSPLPMVVDSTWGTGVVLPWLVPSASLGVLCVPNIPRDVLIRLAKSGVCGEFVMASSTADVRARMGKKTDAYLPTFQAWIDGLRETFACMTFPEERDVREPINTALGEQMLRLSRYVGCPIAQNDHGAVMSYGDFEYPLFTAFVLMVLCLARRVAIDRSAVFSLGMTSFGGTVSVTLAKGEGQNVEDMQELITLRALAERKNMPFSYAEADSLLCIRFSPVSKDWSYLELKSPDTFAWLTK